MSHYNKPTIVLFCISAARDSILQVYFFIAHIFRTYFSISFKFFKNVFSHQSHPPKLLLNMQIIAAARLKPENSNFWPEMAASHYSNYSCCN